MKTRLAALLVAAAVFAGFAVAGLGQPGGPQQPMVLRGAVSSSPLLGITYGRLDTWVTRLDPNTLRVQPGRKLALGRFASGWSFSPDRARLAFGTQPSSSNDSEAGIRLVDAGSMRTEDDIALGVVGYVAVLHWSGPDRLQAVVRSRTGDSVVVVDTVARRVLARDALAEPVGAVGRAKSALVLLLEPRTYGPVTVAVVDGTGALRSVTLDRIEAGASTTAPPNSVGQRDFAGLAVDAGGNRAFAVAAGAPVAEVDLGSLAVSYRTPTQPVSLLGRLHDWLEPKAQAKELLVRSVRYASWVGDGQLAVVGSNGAPSWENGQLQVRERPSGLLLVDTRSWTSHVLDPRASSLVLGRDTLLSWGLGWDSGRQREIGTGLSVYAPTGVQRFHLFGARPIYDVQVVGSRAFVRKAGVESRYSIVSLRSGRQLRTIRGREMPLVLSGAGSAFAG
jgi:hypothetical protein